MINKDQIEELGWAETATGDFMFESDYESIIYWLLEKHRGEIRIASMSDTEHATTEYRGDVEDPMELYDIMVNLNIIPSDEETQSEEN